MPDTTTLSPLDPFEDPEFHALPDQDKVGILQELTPWVGSQEFIELPPQDQEIILGGEYPSFATQSPEGQRAFTQQLRGRGERIPTAALDQAAQGGAGRDAAELMKVIESGLRAPQEYMLGLSRGVPGDRLTFREATNTTPEALAARPLIGSVFGVPLDTLRNIGIEGGDIATNPWTWGGLGVGTAIGKVMERLGQGAGKIPPVPIVEAPLTSLTDLARQAREQQYGGGTYGIAEDVAARAKGVQQSGLHAPGFRPGGSSEFIEQPPNVKYIGEVGGATPQSIIPFGQKKPGFLETAEERIRGRAPIKDVEGKLRELFERRASRIAEDNLHVVLNRQALNVDDVIRPGAQGERSMAYQAMLKERAAQPRPPDPTPPALQKLAMEFEGGAPPGGDLPKGGGFRPSPEGGPLETEPGWFKRTFTPGLEALEQGGPVSKQLSKLLHGHMDKVERDASNIMGNVDAELGRIWGRRSFIGRKAHRGFNPWKQYTMGDIYNIPPDAVNQMVDFAYTHGKIRATGPNAAKIEETARVFFEKGTKPISSHEGVRMGGEVETPWGAYKPYNEPSLFFPQQPTSTARRLLLQDRHLSALYKAAERRGFEGTYNEYKAQMNLWVKGDDSITAARFGGLSNSREFHADDFGRPSEVLKRFGYNTDPLQVLFRFVTGGLRSGEGKLIAPQANVYVQAIERNLTSQGLSGQFARDATNRVLGTEPLDVQEKMARGITQLLISTNDATLMQLAGLGQLAQASYIPRGGMLNTAKAITQWMRQGGTTPEVYRTGSMFTELLNELAVPTTRTGQYATGVVRAGGLTGADAWVRSIGALVGQRHVRDLGAKLLESPTNPKIRAILESLGVDPTELLKAKGLTKDMVDQAAQRFANQTSGRNDIRTLPLWLTSDDPHMRLFAQYKKFMFNNTGEMARQLRLYGPWTVGRTVGTTIGLGEVTRDLHYGLTHLETPFQPLSNEKRITKPLREIHKYSPLAARAIDDFVFGAGSVYSLIAMTALETDLGRLASAVSPTFGLVGEPLTAVSRALQSDSRNRWVQPARIAARRVHPLLVDPVEKMVRVPPPGFQPFKPFQPYLQEDAP